LIEDFKAKENAIKASEKGSMLFKSLNFDVTLTVKDAALESVFQIPIRIRIQEGHFNAYPHGSGYGFRTETLVEPLALRW